MSKDDLPPALEKLFDKAAGALYDALLAAYDAGYKARKDEEPGHSGSLEITPSAAPPAEPEPAPPPPPPPPADKNLVLPVKTRAPGTLTPNQKTVLDAIQQMERDKEDITQNAIARKVGAREGAFIVSQLRNLERMGLVRNAGQTGRPLWQSVPSLTNHGRVDEPVKTPIAREHIQKPACARPVSLRSPPLIAPHMPRAAGTGTVVTQALLGADGNGGRNADVGDRGGIRLSTYLIRRGHVVSLAKGGWIIDGKFQDRYDAVQLVNAHRAKADVPPCDANDLE